MAEVASLLTGQPNASPEDAIDWLQDLTAALSIPGLGNYGLIEAEIEPVVTAAQKASSMRGNAIELSDAEVAEIVTLSH
jgi:alcohol dehydrogenase class IV